MARIIGSLAPTLASPLGDLGVIVVCFVVCWRVVWCGVGFGLLRGVVHGVRRRDTWWSFVCLFCFDLIRGCGDTWRDLIDY